MCLRCWIAHRRRREPTRTKEREPRGNGPQVGHSRAGPIPAPRTSGRTPRNPPPRTSERRSSGPRQGRRAEAGASPPATVPRYPWARSPRGRCARGSSCRQAPRCVLGRPAPSAAGSRRRRPPRHRPHALLPRLLAGAPIDPTSKRSSPFHWSVLGQSPPLELRPRPLAHRTGPASSAPPTPIGAPPGQTRPLPSGARERPGRASR